MTTEPTYDPVTCITACELRAIGVPIPAHVPDCGWIKRTAISMKPVAVKATPGEIAQGMMTVNLETVITQPFRWIELNATITKA